MSKKLLKFIILMTIVVVMVWILGEVLIIAVIKLGTTASIVWTVLMIVTALGLSIYKSFKKDDDKNNRNW